MRGRKLLLQILPTTVLFTAPQTVQYILNLIGQRIEDSPELRRNGEVEGEV